MNVWRLGDGSNQYIASVGNIEAAMDEIEHHAGIKSHDGDGVPRVRVTSAHHRLGPTPYLATYAVGEAVYLVTRDSTSPDVDPLLAVALHRFVEAEGP